MKNIHYILMCLLFTPLFLGAQKLGKTLDYLQDGKYDKAEDNFRNLLAKDSSRVIYQVGLSQTYQKMYESQQMIQSPVMYKICLGLLKRSRENYSWSEKEDRELMAEKMQVKSVADITPIMEKLSAVLWTTYYEKELNLDSTQYFLESYCYGEDLKVRITNLMADLQFKKVKRINTIQAYQNYLNDYPGSSNEAKALDEIQRIEISDALANQTALVLERLMRKYPSTPRMAEIKEKLANLYFSSMNEKTDQQTIQKIKTQLKDLGTDYARALSDSCDRFLSGFEYKRVLESNNIKEIQSFLDNNKLLTVQELDNMRHKKWELIIKVLAAQKNLDFVMLQELVKEAPMNTSGLNDLLGQASVEIKQQCKEALRQFFEQFIAEKASMPDKYQSAMAKFLEDNFNTTIQLDQKEIYTQLVAAKTGTESADIMSNLVTDIKLFEKMLEQDLYFKMAMNDWSIVNVRKKNSDGTYKKSQIVLSASSANYYLIPELKTNTALFNPLKRKYAINSFSVPEAISTNDGQEYEARIYGYKTTDQSCCPSMIFMVQYSLQNGEWTPQFVNSLNDNAVVNLEEETAAEFHIGAYLMQE